MSCKWQEFWSRCVQDLKQRKCEERWGKKRKKKKEEKSVYTISTKHGINNFLLNNELCTIDTCSAKWCVHTSHTDKRVPVQHFVLTVLLQYFFFFFFFFFFFPSDNAERQNCAGSYFHTGKEFSCIRFFFT